MGGERGGEMSGLQNEAPDCAGHSGAPTKLYWEYTAGGMGGAHAILMAGDGKYVGHFYDDVSEGVDIDAVLALVATSPELLCELRKQVDWLRHIRPLLAGKVRDTVITGLDQSIKYMSATIAKAEGRS